MNVVIWARVSSREQREGYSIDAQLRATRDRAFKNGWTVVRELTVAESAKRGAERHAFNQMIDWVKANAKRENLRAILSHKLDRVCRNMRDAVRMQELEDKHGVTLAFVENQFGPGPAGALSFNVMAAVAQYYSDNLRTEVLKGIDERTKQGWQHSRAPFGYLNVSDDRDEPIQPHPENAQAVVRLFELHSSGQHTFESLGRRLADEGFTYRASQPKFNRTAISYILNNRFYIGEIRRGGNHYQGRHQPLVGPLHLPDLSGHPAAQNPKNEGQGQSATGWRTLHLRALRRDDHGRTHQAETQRGRRSRPRLLPVRQQLPGRRSSQRALARGRPRRCHHRGLDDPEDARR